jgi:hypothetical protein
VTKLARYRKALVAGISALAVVGSQLPPDAPRWLAALFAVAGAVAVAATPNKAPTGKP